MARRAVDGPEAAHPQGWKGGSRDFGVVNNFNGHLSVNRFRTTPMGDADFDRRNPCDPYEYEDEDY
jgi:hypothetical protein